MSYINKTEDEIRQSIIETGTENTGIKNFKTSGVLRGIWETIAAIVFQIYENVINEFYNSITWENATGFILKLHALILGIKPKTKTAAEGSFTCEAYAGGIVKSGSWIKTELSGLRFKVTEDTAFVSGTFDIPVKAEFEGTSHNIIDGTAIRFSSTVYGITSVSVPEDWTTTPGTDDESDESIRSRISARWDAQGDDNRASKYESLSRDVDGVQDVFVVRAPRGPGSINIVVSATNGLPSEALLDIVRAAIEDARLIARDTLVLGFTAVYNDFSIQYKGDATAQEVEDVFRAWILDRSIGESIPLETLYKKSLSELDLTYLYFITPTADLNVISTSKNLIDNLTVEKLED